MSEGDADQLSIACTLLTRTSQRRYNQPNIAMDTTATYASLPNVAFHEERKPACGAVTSSYKEGRAGAFWERNEGPRTFANIVVRCRRGWLVGKALVRSSASSSYGRIIGSSCLIWLVIAPISVCALQYKGRSPSWRAASLNVHRSS